ncbi:MAG: short-chain fatty acid transporter [Flavobacteriales bacterium]|nr:short-chain fatty acid transporter [Flavobacteriales bacterium]
MKFADKYAKIFQFLLPTPFTIAVILTFITFAIAFLFTGNTELSNAAYAIKLVGYWEEGLWNNGLMVFAMQMMLILVLGHVLALSPLVEKGISKITQYANNTAKAALFVSFFTIIVAFFNWGLGLIFGAIFARKIAEHAVKQNLKINYPLIGAAGYIGLMVWHGGISGSSLTKVAESGHLSNMMQGILSLEQISKLPVQISFSETVFSPMNLFSSIAVLIILPCFLYLLGKNESNTKVPTIQINSKQEEKASTKHSGAEKLDYSKFMAYGFAAIILAFAFYKITLEKEPSKLGFITPNYLNFLLFGLGILLHQNFHSFLKAIDQAISGAAGILIQFPLYFGIMGIMKSSGLVDELSTFFVSISNDTTFPVFTMISAGLVNIFVPSGGGQWAVQGPIIVQASQVLGISLPKSILALAYGDQLTNMLQPFWALPLLGITGLKAKEILPYTLLMMLVGGAIYLTALLIF